MDLLIHTGLSIVSGSFACVGAIAVAALLVLIVTIGLSFGITDGRGMWPMVMTFYVMPIAGPLAFFIGFIWSWRSF